MSRPPSRALFPLAATLVCILASCGGERKPAPESPVVQEVESPVESLDERREFLRGSKRVKLLDPGKGERSPLRYHPVQGMREQLRMTMQMKMAMSIGEMAPAIVNAAPMQVTIDLETTEVSAEGLCSYAFVFRQARVAAGPEHDPLVAARMEASLQALIGAGGQAQVDTRGVHRDIALALPPGLDAQTIRTMRSVEDNIESMTTILPEEPIGIGARWQVRSILNTEGLEIFQTQTIELVERDAQGFRLVVSTKQEADEQEGAAPNMPEGYLRRLDALRGSGSSEARVPAEGLAPRKARGAAHSDTSMTIIDPGGQEQRMRIVLDMGMDFSRVPSAGDEEASP